MREQASVVGQQGPPRSGASSQPTQARRPPNSAVEIMKTIADFYRAEAARCRDRAEKAKTPERATRWRHVADDCLRVAEELEAADGPMDSSGASSSSQAQ